MDTLTPFQFIKSANALDEDHELFNPDIEETIQRLGLPYNMAMAVRVSQANITEERKNYYIEEIKEKSKGVVQEHEELQRRFLGVCNELIAKEQYEAELKAAQESGKVILADTMDLSFNPVEPIEDVSSN